MEEVLLVYSESELDTHHHHHNAPFFLPFNVIPQILNRFLRWTNRGGFLIGRGPEALKHVDDSETTLEASECWHASSVAFGELDVQVMRWRETLGNSFFVSLFDLYLLKEHFRHKIKILTVIGSSSPSQDSLECLRSCSAFPHHTANNHDCQGPPSLHHTSIGSWL